MSRKLVYIMSTGHAGSTMLDLLLGAHPKMVGLGEVNLTIRRLRDEQHACTCGESARDCAIWGEVFRRVDRGDDVSAEDTYSILIDRIHATYSSDHIAVDSSKYPPGLEVVQGLKDLDVSVLYLLKDVRSYVQSTTTLNSNTRWIHTSALYRTLQWSRGNRAMKDFLTDTNARYLQMSYEELCFDKNGLLEEVAEFLGIEAFPDEHSPQVSKSHILRGNQMRFDTERRARVRYDNRWFFSLWIQIVARAWPGVRQWNDENVYSRANIHRKKKL